LTKLALCIYAFFLDNNFKLIQNMEIFFWKSSKATTFQNFIFVFNLV